MLYNFNTSVKQSTDINASPQKQKYHALFLNSTYSTTSAGDQLTSINKGLKLVILRVDLFKNCIKLLPKLLFLHTIQKSYALMLCNH